MEPPKNLCIDPAFQSFSIVHQKFKGPCFQISCCKLHICETTICSFVSQFLSLKGGFTSCEFVTGQRKNGRIKKESTIKMNYKIVFFGIRQRLFSSILGFVYLISSNLSNTHLSSIVRCCVLSSALKTTQRPTYDTTNIGHLKSTNNTTR